jgi:cytochrome bd-type quinol oxidase subunit 1
VPDAAFAVELRNRAHVKHLLDDIRVAEELDIRYRDRMAGYRLVETFGIVSRHGRRRASPNGNVDRQAQQPCLATLFHTIASTHGVTIPDIEGIRPQLTDRGFDLPVTVPVVLLLASALTRFIRWMRNRFEADEWLAWLLAALAGSLVVPAIVLGLGWLWAMLVDIVRVGNEHVGYRERSESLRANFVVIFGIGIAATWIGSAICAIRKRADSSSIHVKASAS